MKNNLSISLVLSSILCSCLDAQVMDIGTNFYRDYLDLAQNKGIFKATDAPLEFTQRNGAKFTFNKIPNNNARNNKGNFTALGRNFVVTANHTLLASAATNFNENRGWFGNTLYEYATNSTQKLYGADTTYLRTSKYIVEGQIDPLDVPNLEISSQDQTKDEANTKKIEDRFREIKNSGGASGENILAYEAGTGSLALEKPKSDSDGFAEVMSATEFEHQNIVNNALGASVNEIGVAYSAVYKSHYSSVSKPGVYLFMTSNRGFRNRLLPGDSGSGFFVYDTVAQKWVLVGVLTGVEDNRNYASIVTARDFNDYKKEYENLVSGVNVLGSALVQNKDNIFSSANGSNITLNSNLDLGHGGIVVNSGDFTLNSTNGSKIAKFAGFDIAGGASLNLNVTSDTSVHKLGKGSLIVSSSGNKPLRLGEGVVELRALNAFDKIYLTSGRGLLRLGVNENLNDKIFFGNGGGVLDLNGFDQTFDNISANSSDAKITNENSQRAILKINGEIGKDTIFHASIDKNIELKHSGQGKELVFDGGFDIDGALSLENAKVTLQGHPKTHAIGDASVLTPLAKSKIAAAGLSEPAYMDLARPSTLYQPDWDERKFSAKDGIKLKSSELTIGKDAKLNGDITAKNSVINLSGELTHYIDKFDGSNTYDDGLKYRQDIESKNLLVKDVKFDNKIVMDSDSLLRVGGGATKLKELVINGKDTPLAKDVLLGDGKFEVENLEVSGAQKLGFEPDSLIKKSLKIKSFGSENEPVLDFKKVLTLGAGMKFDVDFTAALKGGMALDKTYTLVSAQNIINEGAIFNNEQKLGDLFMTYAISDGKIVMKLSDKKGENPAVSSNVVQERVSKFSQRENKILSMLKGTPEFVQAISSGDDEVLRKLAQKADKDMKEISTSSLKVSMKALQNSNELMNSRLFQVTQLRAKADISQFKLAGLESDIMPSAKMAYEAAEASRERNNFWANVNGAYFKDRQSDGDLKFYGTNIGYDRGYDEFILGVSAGVSKAKFSSDVLKDDAKIYSFGAYGLFERGAHEIQSNLNFAFINSKRSLDEAQKASAKGRGILSSNYYKYKISLSKSGEFEQSIKPLLALEFGANGIDGFKNDRYDQKSINDFDVAVAAGVEYALNSEKNAFSVQFLVKQSIYNSEDKSYVSLNNSNEYVDYKLDNNKLSYKLTLNSDTKLSENVVLSSQLSGMLDNDKNYGISGGLKIEYKF
ncbi:S6 family peptidase [Campylobacter concisus]|uniref:S6 family peptidase n=1 Tax=Campylobacter concisus TaxID=199 RepID=UPI001956FCA3|nr:S6 family peptidase [Campylobacter concisus]VTX98606.1 Serine protease pet autotransporter [Campylobacter concisus]